MVWKENFLFQTKDSGDMIVKMTKGYHDFDFYVRIPEINDTGIINKISVEEEDIIFFDENCKDENSFDSLLIAKPFLNCIPNGVWLNFERNRIEENLILTIRFKIIDSLVEGKFYRYNKNILSGVANYDSGYLSGWQYDIESQIIKMMYFDDSTKSIRMEVVINFEKDMVDVLENGDHKFMFKNKSANPLDKDLFRQDN